jgi:hypothetical protein
MLDHDLEERHAVFPLRRNAHVPVLGRDLQLSTVTQLSPPAVIQISPPG